MRSESAEPRRVAHHHAGHRRSRDRSRRARGVRVGRAAAEEPADRDERRRVRADRRRAQPDPALGAREVTALAAADGVAWAVAARRSIARRDRGTWVDVARSDSRDRVPATDARGRLRRHRGRACSASRRRRLEPVDSSTPSRAGTRGPRRGAAPAVRSIARDLGGGSTRTSTGWHPSFPRRRRELGANDRHRRRHPPGRRAPDRTRCRARRGRRRARRERGRGSELADRAARPARDVRAGRRRRGGHDPALGSNGPRGGRAALYRTRGPDPRLERCTDGLPEWFDGNIDSGWLVARDRTSRSARATA